MTIWYSLEHIVALEEIKEKEKKGIEKMMDLIVDKIYAWDIESNGDFKTLNRQLSSAYTIMKDKFSDIYRDGWERYFEHLRAVANIVLTLDNPNEEKALIAMLHDSIEDTDIDYHTLKILYWANIAIAVQALSKKPETDYKSKAWLTAKEIRNKEYFSHLESFESMRNYIEKIAIEDWFKLNEQELDKITKNTIDVKLADRIHNLSTQWNEDNTAKVKRKLDETKIYFLQIAKETNKVAYDKIMTLVLDLELKLVGFNKKVEKVLIK